MDTELSPASAVILRAAQPPASRLHQGRRRDSRLRYSCSSSSDNDDSDTKRPISRYTVDQQLSSGDGCNNDSGIGGVTKPRLQATSCDNRHSSSADHQLYRGSSSGTGPVIQRLYTYLSADGTDSEEATSGIGDDAAMRDRRRRHQRGGTCSSGRRPFPGDRHQWHQQQQLAEQTGTMPSDVDPLSTCVPPGDDRSSDVIGDSSTASRRSRRYRSGTESLGSSRTSENFYSRINDDTLPLSSGGVATSMIQSRPSIYLPPPPPVESCPPMPPRRTTTFGTQTIDRAVSNQRQNPSHQRSIDEASAARRVEDNGSEPISTQFLVQTPFGCVFAPSSQVNNTVAPSFNCHVAVRPTDSGHHTYLVGSSSLPGVESGETVSTSLSGTGNDQFQQQTELFARPGLVVNSTSSGFVTGLNQRGFNSCRTDRVGATLPVYPTTGSSRKETGQTTFGSKRFTTVAGYKVKRQLQQRCSWRCICMLLSVLCVLLVAMVTYFIAMKAYNLSWSLEKEALLVESEASRPSTSQIINSNQVPTSSPHATAAQYQLGTTSRQLVASNEFWRMMLYLPESKTVRFNASFVVSSLTSRNDDVISGDLNREAAIGVYGRRGLAPTHAQYDFFHVADASKSSQSRSSRSVKMDNSNSGQARFYQYLDVGLWYIFIYNDSPSPQMVEFQAATQDVLPTDECPNNCNNRGECVDQLCKCFQGYSGHDCSISNCKSLCNGRGKYVGGICRCHTGWSGPECQLRSRDDCQDPTCGNGNGMCVNGRCVCAPGYQGLNCTDGSCVEQCVHGSCQAHQCVCDEYWEGDMCTIRKCDPRCSLHGTCSNGTCQCQPGWNGRHCSIDGCPQSCSGHGTCRRQLSGDWSCACDESWSGLGCNVAMETVCHGGVDDDEDGATDCLDPDCCLNVACRDQGNCQMSPDPMEILLRKQPPSSTASFFEKMKFLIEDDSVQSYATLSSFNPSQVSVIRGRVVGIDDVSLVGVRVSIVTQPLYGFTLTREHGQFDILVNGGGSVTVMFQRPPFKARQVTVMVPWNRMVTMETVVLLIEGKSGSTSSEAVCPPSVIHDYRRTKPTILSTWQHTQLGACSSVSTVIPESQIVKESLQIPGTGVFLSYHSSTAPGYMSTVMIQLTPDIVPSNLSVIRLKVTIEGVVFEKLFEAEASLKYKFAWDRRNAYNQKVYGIVTANVAVGYQYNGCRQIFWETRSATLSGYDISSSEIGGWNLNVHHMYNFQEGILHKGDGTNVFLKERPRRISTILGNGRVRPLDCRRCDGKAEEASLMAPVALASGRDGSLYIGDYNFIRRLNAARDEITSILQLNMSEVPYKYYMTVSSLDGKLYISDHRSLRLFRVKTMGSDRDLSQNAEVIAGTGEQCIPGEPNQCGDGGLAINAQLFYPKGLAINKDGVLYFADGPNIRSIDVTGRISTVIGSQGPLRYWQPFSCDTVMSANEVMLQWPTALAINPLDDTLHVLDGSMVLKLTRYGHVFPLAGRAHHCPPSNLNLQYQLLLDREATSMRLATDLPLIRPQHIAFNPAGDMYIVEEGKGESAGTGMRSANRVRVVGTSGVISDYVGGGGAQSCDCRQGDVGSECLCLGSREETTASESNSKLGAPAAVTVTPDGIVHVADMGNLRVHSIVVALPTADRVTGHYDVIDDTSQELYTFNRFGQHVSTRHVLTGSVLYNFTYNVNSYYSKLVRVSDASFTPTSSGIGLASSAGSRNSIVIKRDYRLLAQDITPPGGPGLRCRLTMDNMGHLSAFTTVADNVTTKFEYSGNTGLMTSKENTRTGQVYGYEFDRTGRISVIVKPTGSRTRFDTDVDQSGAIVKVSDDSSGDGDSTALATNGNVLTLVHGRYRMKVSQHGDRSLTLEYPFKMAVALETIPHPLLGSEYRLQARRQIVLPNNLTHRFEWRYYQRPDGQSRKTKTSDRVIGRQMKVNGETVLAFEYDRLNRTETVLDRRHESLLTISYDAVGRVVQVAPRRPIDGLRVSYDHHGHITKWTRGVLNVTTAFDDRGRLTERRFGTRTAYNYVHTNGSKAIDSILPSGKQYQFLYDASSNLKFIVTPGRNVHHFARLSSPLVDRDIYRPPATDSMDSSKNALVFDYDTAGRRVRTSFPSGFRRFVHRYGSLGQLTAVAFDQTDNEYIYHSDSMKLTTIRSVDQTSGNVSSSLNYGDPTEALTKSHNVTSSAFVAAARFRYAYDSHFRVSSMQAAIGDVELPEASYHFDAETGRLERLFGFHVDAEVTRTGQRIAIRDVIVEILREQDSLGRQTDVSYTFNNYMVFGLEIKYDVLGRVFQWRRKVGSSDQRVIELVYDVDSHVTEVIVNGQSMWHYETDPNGDIVQSIHHGNVRSVVVNGRGQTLQSATGKTCSYDVDGFIIQRGDAVFRWNSLGRLVESSSETESDGFRTKYLYDPLARLSAIVSQRNSVETVLLSVQLFYGDLVHINRVTHVFDDLTKSTIELIYDVDGRLFALRRNGVDLYYIATDPFASPIVVFSSTGGVVRLVDYDPLGSVISDSSQMDFPLLIAYRGAIYDPTSKLLFFDAGATVYDPELGTWIGPDYRVLAKRNRLEQELLEWPHLVNFYQTGFLTVRLLRTASFPLTDMSSWLSAVGYHYDSLVPSVSFDGTIRRRVNDAAGVCQRREVTSAFHCAFDREEQTFSASSQLVGQSSLVAAVHDVVSSYQNTDVYSSFSAYPYVFGDGVKLTVDDYRSVSVDVTASQLGASLSLLAAAVMNGSRAVGVGYLLENGHSVDFFVREVVSLDRVTEDIRSAGLEPGAHRLRLDQDCNVTVDRWPRRRQHANGTQNGEQFIDVIIRGQHSTAHVRYVSQTSVHRDETKDWEVRVANERAVELAWASEAHHDSQQWSREQREQLISTGRVTGVRVKFIRSSSRWPEFADDPTNIRFIADD